MVNLAHVDDRSLFHQISRGDEHAYREFYNRHWNRVYTLALTYLKSTALAEDILQEIFLKVWAKRESLADVDKPEAYLYSMARNFLINAFHRKMEVSELTEDSDPRLPDDLLLPDQAVDLKQLQESFQREIEKLPPQQQLIFRLSREEGFTHEQIAQKLGIQKHTVKNHMVRALNRLRQVLGENGYLIFLALLFNPFSGN